MALNLQQLDAYLANNSYLGSEAGVTLEDYKVCTQIAEGSVKGETMPSLARWYRNVSFLKQKYPNVDCKGVAIPAGKSPALGAAAVKAAPTSPKKAPEPKKEAAPKKEAVPKKEAGAKNEKKGKDASASAGTEPTPEELEKMRKDKLKKTIKEGGKRGVEIEGAADMGGLQFFCTSVDCPDGDLDLLVESMKAMNAKSDPSEEERKGGSGNIGKMIFSAGTDQLAVVAYVPEAKQDACSCAEWLSTVLAVFGGTTKSTAKDVCSGVVKTNSDKGIFPLKIREPMILEANNYLRQKGLFPDDAGSDDDDVVFWDDDFPEM